MKKRSVITIAISWLILLIICLAINFGTFRRILDFLPFMFNGMFQLLIATLILSQKNIFKNKFKYWLIISIVFSFTQTITNLLSLRDEDSKILFGLFSVHILYDCFLLVVGWFIIRQIRSSTDRIKKP